MNLARSVASTLPQAWTFRHDKPTLLVSWWCTFYSITVILFRVCGRYVRAEKVFIEDIIMVIAVAPLLIRMGLAHVVILHGTNNVDTTGLTATEIDRRVIGSQIVIASRIMYTTYLWTIKLSFSIFLRSLTASIWQQSHQKLLTWLHIALGATFVGCVISDLTPCHPFSHNWQVVPDPGPTCRRGYGHLFTNGALNIITNIMLILFPIPMIIGSRLPFKQRVTILLRMSLPLLNITMTIYQIYRVTLHNGDQPLRTLLASIDILLVTFTSNAVVLSSLLQDRGYKKSKYRHVQELHYVANAPRLTAETRHHTWEDSDDDLMMDIEGKDVGGDSDGTGGNGIGMKVLKIDGKSVVVKKTARIEDQEEMARLRTLPSAKLQDIRVATTWEISHESSDRRGQSFYSNI